jgi:hypothetical protein
VGGDLQFASIWRRAVLEKVKHSVRFGTRVEFGGISGIIGGVRYWGSSMRVVKAIAIVVIGPVLGVLIGSFLGALALRPDPNFVANGGHAAPGDGFLIIGYVLVSLLISIPSSVLLAGIVLFRKPKAQG